MEESRGRESVCGTGRSVVVPTFSRDQALLRPNNLFSKGKLTQTVKPQESISINKENENPDNFPKSHSATESLSPINSQTVRIFPGGDAIKKQETKRQRPHGSSLTVKRNSRISMGAKPHGQVVEEDIDLIVEEEQPTYLLEQEQDLIPRDKPKYGQASDLNQEAKMITQKSQCSYGIGESQVNCAVSTGDPVPQPQVCTDQGAPVPVVSKESPLPVITLPGEPEIPKEVCETEEAKEATKTVNVHEVTIVSRYSPVKQNGIKYTVFNMLTSLLVISSLARYRYLSDSDYRRGLASGRFKNPRFRSPVLCTDPSFMKESSATGFLEIEFYWQHGAFAVIYYILDDILGIDFKKMVEIDRGGNAIVYRYGKYVIKRTPYNKNQLNLICKLDDINVIRLLGVVLEDPCSSDMCFHVMERMTDDLHSVFSRFDPKGLLCHISNSNKKENVVSCNLLHIFKQIAMGISYMKSNNMRHGDIKGRNILFHQECRCQDILVCDCSMTSGEKCVMKLADFDYIRRIDFKPQEWTSRREGTLTYRAPEIDGQGREVGTHSDMYSVGVVILDALLGRWDEKDIQDTNDILRQTRSSQVSTSSEVVLVQRRLNKLLGNTFGITYCSGLSCLIKLMIRCLKPDYNSRPTPEEFTELLDKV